MDKSKKIPESLDYWKKYITLHHVLACELSYSLIYNNIRPDKVGDALATVGLDTLPNRFLLLQVDDYYNYSSKMIITQEFFQKTILINLMRECMDSMGLKGLHDFRLYQPAVQQAGAVFPDVSKNGSGAEQKLLLGKGVQYPFGGGGAGCGGGPGGSRYK